MKILASYLFRNIFEISLVISIIGLLLLKEPINNFVFIFIIIFGILGEGYRVYLKSKKK